jgi:hypothetical protein
MNQTGKDDDCGHFLLSLLSELLKNVPSELKIDVNTEILKGVKKFKDNPSEPHITAK